FFFFFSQSSQPKYSAHLAMQSDAMALVNYYIPKVINLQDAPPEDNLILPAFQSTQPKFGALTVGNSNDSIITVALDEGKIFSMIYIDKNNNEDLTDDGDPNWGDEKTDYLAKEVLVDVSYKRNKEASVPYPVQFYRYKARLKDTLVAFRNGYREGKVTFPSTSFKIALLDDNLNGLFDDLRQGAMVIDLDRNGILNGAADSPEHFPLSAPFNIDRQTYRVDRVTPSGDLITFVAADTMVNPKTVLETGESAPNFRAQTIDGKILEPELLKNKVVLIDFWATWCKPWEEELVHVRRSYQRNHGRGFEIVGISLDNNLDSLKTFLEVNKVSWPQICDLRGWDTPWLDIFRVAAVPKNFLLDRNGVIRYKDVHGPSLGEKVYELLNEPSVDHD
ncbi:TlpA family protein disulfide reductase, partial [bacterium]|nr:TlpA family protein disulfide reductase [bacterium]